MYSKGTACERSDGSVVKTGGNDDTRLKSTIRAEINELTQHKLEV